MEHPGCLFGFFLGNKCSMTLLRIIGHYNYPLMCTKKDASLGVES